MSFSELEKTIALANGKNLSKNSVSENYVLEDCDKKMLKIMSNYKYDYKKIAQNILKGKIDFLVKYINKEGHYEKLYRKLVDISFGCDSGEDLRCRLNSSSYTDAYKKIKYEKGILMIGDFEIKDVNDISKIFDTFFECLTEHGEYLKRYLQKKAELEEKLGFLNEEDTNISENKTDDLF